MDSRAIKVMSIFGTRPEAIKMAPLVKKLQENKYIESILCVTAQHRQMLDQVLEIFDLKPDYDLDIMSNKQTLVDITIKALEGLDSAIKKATPDIILIHGDTTTTFVGSLAAFYNKVKIGHVEAGLRTFDKYFPYPEEINRKLTGVMADLHFAPTKSNKSNLINEGVDKKSIFITGNTALDAIKATIDKNYYFNNKELNKIDFTKRIILVTAHRRENLGEPLENICYALKHIAENYSDIEIVYPVHLNPVVRGTAEGIIGSVRNVHLIQPLNVRDMHNLMDRSYIVMTDSGGLQEEAPSLGKPVLVLRNETERPEAVSAGTVKIAGVSRQRIIDDASLLLDDKKSYDKMARAINPYGDGRASERIVNAILYSFGAEKKPPQEWVVQDT